MLRLALDQVIKKERDQTVVSREKVFKINQVIFKLSYQKFRWQSYIKIEVAKVIIKTKVIFGYHAKDVSNQV